MALVTQNRFSQVIPARDDPSIVGNLAAALGRRSRGERFAQLLGPGTEGQPPAVDRQQQIAQMAIQNPAEFESAMKSMGLINQQQKNEAADFAVRMMSTPYSMRKGLINQRIQELQAQGRNASDTESLLQMDEQAQNDALNAVQVMALDPQQRLKFAQGDTAAMKTFRELTSGLSEEETERARRIELGLEPRATARTAEREAAITAGKEAAKLQARYKFEPQVAAAVVEAKKTAEDTAKRAGEAKTNENALNVYNTGMASLTEALGGTETGPIAGRLPALTANQQIAEGAIAVMAPILKQMFRSAGEGTFTDADQALLMGMIPTRKDTPEARDAKIKSIDSIVRAKLGQTEEKSISQDVTQMSDEELMRIIEGR